MNDCKAIRMAEIGRLRLELLHYTGIAKDLLDRAGSARAEGSEARAGFYVDEAELVLRVAHEVGTNMRLMMAIT